MSVSGGKITTAIKEAFPTFQERAIRMGITAMIEKKATITEMEAKMVLMATMEMTVLKATKMTTSTSTISSDY